MLNNLSKEQVDTLRDIHQCMEIFRTYCPNEWKDTNKKLNIIQAIYTYPEYQKDFIGFVDYMTTTTDRINTPNWEGVIYYTLMHDIDGLVRKEKMFMPRVTGYAKHMTKTTEINN